MGSNPDCVIFGLQSVSCAKGVLYNLTFWAKAAAAVRLQLNARMDSARRVRSQLIRRPQHGMEAQTVTFSLPSTFGSVSDALVSSLVTSCWRHCGLTPTAVAAAPVTMRTSTWCRNPQRFSRAKLSRITRLLSASYQLQTPVYC